ncbi:MAG: ATP-binding cassette domain-containing protein, partial [Mariprofundaceae bacterium]
DIGFIYQAHHLVPELDACENVMLPLLVGGKPAVEARLQAVAMLTRLGLGERLLHRPGALSGGEAQRVAVARAIVGKPKLMLADEPTGNLDEGTADEVFDTMKRLCREEGTSVVMVTHSAHLAGKCDRILRLRSGRLHENSEKL